jgi:hypothetical protein
VSSNPEMVKVGFTGHQGLTAETAKQVRIALNEYLVRHGDVHGFCSLAEGSDQIFAAALLDQSSQLTAVIPCRDYESTFSVDALRTYNELKSRAIDVIALDFPDPSEEAFWAAGQRVVQESTEIVAVWDGEPSGGLGGTADVVGYAKRLGKDVHIIWPQGAARQR